MLGVRKKVDELVSTFRDIVQENERLKAENEELCNGISEAAGIIVELCGECPVSRYEFLSSEECQSRCVPDIERQCWKEYLTRERWHELGIEVSE